MSLATQLNMTRQNKDQSKTERALNEPKVWTQCSRQEAEQGRTMAALPV